MIILVKYCEIKIERTFMLELLIECRVESEILVFSIIGLILDEQSDEKRYYIPVESGLKR